jgi:hypothetical protein
MKITHTKLSNSTHFSFIFVKFYKLGGVGGLKLGGGRGGGASGAVPGFHGTSLRIYLFSSAFNPEKKRLNMGCTIVIPELSSFKFSSAT